MRYLKRVIEAINRDELLGNEGFPETDEEMLEKYYVKITWRGLFLEVDIYPKSGMVHDCMFSVNIITGKINPDSISIGELIQEPEE